MLGTGGTHIFRVFWGDSIGMHFSHFFSFFRGGHYRNAEKGLGGSSRLSAVQVPYPEGKMPQIEVYLILICDEAIYGWFLGRIRIFHKQWDEPRRHRQLWRFFGNPRSAILAQFSQYCC